MTSINAIKFNHYSGAMICDEQRHWNDDRMKIYGADKILPVVADDIMHRFQLAAAYGNTGTSSIGDEIRLTLRTRIRDAYKDFCDDKDAQKSDFMSIRDIADLTFSILMDVKHQHIDDQLLSRFGFTTREFCQGFQQLDDQEIPIKQPEIIERVQEMIAPPADFSGSNAVFGNKGIVAGYDRMHGFQIFLFSMREQFCEEVPFGFAAEGSGSDTVNFVLPSFFDDHHCLHGEIDIDPVEGIMAIIDAVNLAARKNMGVGGYFNIIVFNGKAPDGDLISEINDHRSHMASEVVTLLRAGYISRAVAGEIIDSIIFQNKDIEWAENILFKGRSKEDIHAMHRFLRGYKSEKTSAICKS
ncbi:hypothetical protein JXQ70_08485 [bacterium]|nr:hypothetical protein [bacterium]